MKKLYVLFTLIFVSLLIFGEGTTTSQISLTWVKVKKRIRSTYAKSKIVEYDNANLDYIEKSSISADAEPDLSEFLLEMINDNAGEHPDNSVKALDILEKKFSNKRFFYNVAGEYGFKNPARNCFVTAKVFKSLSALLQDNDASNFKTLKLVYENVKSPYIYSFSAGTPRYGTEYVVAEIVGYIRNYTKLSKEGKLKENNEHAKYIAVMFGELGLESGGFRNVPGVKELLEEY